MEGMQPDELQSQTDARDDGLGLVKGWTVAAAVGSIGLTGVLAVAAADTFRGHNVAVAAAPAAATPSASALASSSTTPQDEASSAPTPVPPMDSSLGSTSQPPAVVSGGS
jgi:hypothetical protein